MGDMGEAFRDYSKFRKEKRRNNLIYNTDLLIKSEVNFTSKNGGVHLIIEVNNMILDFYPSTGLWWDRNNKGKKYRGVKNLLRYIKTS
ncbi:TPA: hypothetical protein R4341_000755 [Pasteurella multocida]|uniref:hypothetical protein n=1 Tax=Pasteurella multocida TaxID=747 RepID=UPI00202363E8|nr:hypothetical protein [Pasteurella multocida]URH94740.1 hypothetical protein M8850_03160 [Pasteurella multocida]URI01131.1 hypothetical protein M8851_03165 [Pasteurella multocida]WRK11280.1 hypothetical protein RFF16_09845 [Pasteurella multocida]HDR1160558.1 hypothetical protein [Pasteurella multocida]HDR1386371.1 hypothetical protein [Pasteurella multocida]